MKRSEKLFEALTDVDDELLVDSIKLCKTEQKKKYKAKVIGTAAAACLVVVAAAAFVRFYQKPTTINETPHESMTERGTETYKDANDMLPVKWGLEWQYGICSETNEETNLSFLDNEDADGTLYAVNVKAPDLPEAEMLEFVAWRDSKYSKTVEYENEELECAARRVVERLVNERGISRAEAEARKFTDPEFVEARALFKKRKADIIREILKRKAKDNCALFETLKTCSEIVCSADEDLGDNTAAYLYDTDSVAVAIMKKEDIVSLTEDGVMFELACVNYGDYTILDWYSYSEVHLSGESKLTDTLCDIYENGGSDSCYVYVHLTLPEREPDEFDAAFPDDPRGAAWARVLAKFGMTEEEFNSCNDADLVQRIIDAKHADQRREEEYGALREKVFEEGEEVEWFGGYIGKSEAVLTYERALELSRLPEVAYIESELEPYTRIPQLDGIETE